jgi:hypothetical protein
MTDCEALSCQVARGLCAAPSDCDDRWGLRRCGPGGGEDDSLDALVVEVSGGDLR